MCTNMYVHVCVTHYNAIHNVKKLEASYMIKLCYSHYNQIL